MQINFFNEINILNPEQKIQLVFNEIGNSFQHSHLRRAQILDILSIGNLDYA